MKLETLLKQAINRKHYQIVDTKIAFDDQDLNDYLSLEHGHCNAVVECYISWEETDGETHIIFASQFENDDALFEDNDEWWIRVLL